MAQRKRRGFTIIELVIVIAVIAILAGVLIPTFVSVIKKANVASDTSLVKNINEALVAEEVTEGKPVTMYEALQFAERNGFTVEKLTPRSTGDIVWNSESNRFALVNEKGETVYSFNGEKIEKSAKVWKIVATAEEAKNNTSYSSYIKGSETISTLTVTGGIDVGENIVTDLTYLGGAESQDVVIRTNGNMCTLTIYAPNDHVDHYGYAKQTNIAAVNESNSYHEYGTSNKLVVASGKVVVENTGVVFELSRGNVTYVDSNKESKTVTAVTTNTIANNGGNVMHSTVDSVLASNAFEIGNLAQLEAFRDATNSGETFAGKTVNLNCDIALTSAWKPISNYSRTTANDIESASFAGTFNGNGHTISGLTNVGLHVSQLNTGTNNSTPKGGAEVTYGLFASVNGATIKNIKLTNVKISNSGFGTLLGDSVGACVGFTMGQTTIEKITVSGTIEGYDAVGGILGRDKGDKITIKDCINNASVFSNGGAAGIVGRIYKKGCLITIDNCVNNGAITSDYQNAIIEVPNLDTCYAVGITDVRNTVTGTISNCKNTGVITRINPASGAHVSGHIAQITVDKGGCLTKTNNIESGRTVTL